MQAFRIRHYFGLAAVASLALFSVAAQAGPGHPGYFPRSPEFIHQPPFAAGPHWPGPGIEQRQRHLQARIEQGLRSGRLTPYEAQQLFRDLRRSEFLERRFAMDGRLSRAEWAELDHLLDRIARDLRHELRDDERRYGRWGHPGYAWR